MAPRDLSGGTGANARALALGSARHAGCARSVRLGGNGSGASGSEDAGQAADEAVDVVLRRVGREADAHAAGVAEAEVA